LSNEDKQLVIDERKRLNVPRKTRGRGGQNASSVQSKKKSLQKMTKQIAALNTRVKRVEGKKVPSKEDDDDDSVSDNAGDQFGGREKKRQKKNS
jgi:hypothetical protein